MMACYWALIDFIINIYAFVLSVMVKTFHNKWQIIPTSPEILCNYIIHEESIRCWCEWNREVIKNFVSWF